MQRRASGFTLIELAIVIAIIGLIAAATLMSGSGVFGRAGAAALMSNVKDLAAAARQFKTRYGYFPGDLPKAGEVLKSMPPITFACADVPGAGNGVVDTLAESDCALEQLVRAGMLNKVEHESSPVPRFFIASTLGAEVRVSLWFNDASMENAIRITRLPCDAALDLERKLDNVSPDGKPFSQGSVTARDAADAVIENCAVGGANDPVETLLIKY
jgi:prepilin-type N-terminal cleavage/methylation domain-containing protein